MLQMSSTSTTVIAALAMRKTRKDKIRICTMQYSLRLAKV